MNSRNVSEIGLARDPQRSKFHTTYRALQWISDPYAACTTVDLEGTNTQPHEHEQHGKIKREKGRAVSSVITSMLPLSALIFDSSEAFVTLSLPYSRATLWSSDFRAAQEQGQPRAPVEGIK